MNVIWIFFWFNNTKEEMYSVFLALTRFVDILGFFRLEKCSPLVYNMKSTIQQRMIQQGLVGWDRSPALMQADPHFQGSLRPKAVITLCLCQHAKKATHQAKWPPTEENTKGSRWFIRNRQSSLTLQISMSCWQWESIYRMLDGHFGGERHLWNTFLFRLWFCFRIIRRAHLFCFLVMSNSMKIVVKHTEYSTWL